MITYKGPMWVPHGLTFLYGTHMGPIWASCPDSAHMGPICLCVLGSPFLISIDPANPLYCILIRSIYTIYVSGKLGKGGGGTTSKLKILIDLFFIFLTGNKFASIHVFKIHMCNKIKKNKASIFQPNLLRLIV